MFLAISDLGSIQNQMVMFENACTTGSMRLVPRTKDTILGYIKITKESGSRVCTKLSLEEEKSFNKDFGLDAGNRLGLNESVKLPWASMLIYMVGYNENGERNYQYYEIQPN